MGQLLCSLRNARVFSKLDLQQAYLQVKLEPSSKEITAISIPEKGHYQFTRMLYVSREPPPPSNATWIPSLGLKLYSYCFGYLDDIIVTTLSFEEHLEYLSKTFMLLKEAGLKLNQEKCEFAYLELRYLG
jgi:hypothetical protein